MKIFHRDLAEFSEPPLEIPVQNEEGSELQKLMRINAYERPLTQEERMDAYALMAGAERSDENCHNCGNDKAIAGVGVCGVCAHYAVLTRK